MPDAAIGITTPMLDATCTGTWRDADGDLWRWFGIGGWRCQFAYSTSRRWVPGWPKPKYGPYVKVGP